MSDDRAALARTLSEQLVDLADDLAGVPAAMSRLVAELNRLRADLDATDPGALAARSSLRRRIAATEDGVDSLAARRSKLEALVAAVKAEASKEKLGLLAPAKIRAERAQASREGLRRQWFKRRHLDLGVGHANWLAAMRAALDQGDTETLARNGLRVEDGQAVPMEV